MALVNTTQRLIVVANADIARFFAKRSPGDSLLALYTMHPPERFERPRFGGLGARKSQIGGMGIDSHPAKNRQIEFAHHLAERIDHAIASGTCDELAIVASNPFLSELHASLSRQAKSCLVAELDLDLTWLGRSELERRLGDQIRNRRYVA